MLTEEKQGRYGLQRSVADQVLHQLRREIISGQLEPEAKLRLEELTERFKVSHIPVREALRVLQGEGLVVMTAQKGATVAPLSMEDMLEIYNLRVELDGMATRLACQRNEPGWLENVRQSFDWMVEAGDKWGNRAANPPDQPVEEPEAAHAGFHFAIYRGCGSKWLLRMVTMLYYTSERYRRLSTTYRGTWEDIKEEHRQILEALEAGQADMAVRYLQNHIYLTAVVLEKVFNKVD